MDQLFGEGVDPTDTIIRVRNHVFKGLGVMARNITCRATDGYRACRGATENFATEAQRTREEELFNSVRMVTTFESVRSHFEYFSYFLCVLAVLFSNFSAALASWRLDGAFNDSR